MCGQAIEVAQSSFPGGTTAWGLWIIHAPVVQEMGFEYQMYNELINYKLFISSS